MDFDTICKKIFELDSKIRSARIINNKGRLVGGGMRDGLQSLEQAKKDEMLFTELTLRARMRTEFDKEFGSVEFSMSYREKVIFISFPMDENILLISGEKELDFKKIPFQILKIIKGI